MLRQPVSAWLRVIGRLRPGATTDGMGPRLTALLRAWMQHDSGYPSNWMPEIIRTLPEQVITIVPAGSGVGVMKEQYGRSLQILLGVCGLVLLIACANVANLLLARAVARRGQTAIRLAIGASGRQIVGEALLESVLLAFFGAVAGLFVAMGAARLLVSLAFAGATVRPARHHAVAARPRIRGRARARHRRHLRRRAGVARHADRSDRGAARGRAHHRRSRVHHAARAAHRAGHALGGARRRFGDARPQPGQPRGTGLRLHGRGARAGEFEPAAGQLYAGETRGHLSRCRDARGAIARRDGRGPRALQPAYRQLGRAGARGRQARARAGPASGRVVGPRQRQLPAASRREAAARAVISPRATPRPPRASPW